MSERHFWVHGVPKPGGSKRAFIVKTKAGAQRAVVVDSNKNVGDWKDAVLSAARVNAPRVPGTGPISLQVHFNLPRPRSHFGTGKNADKIKPSAPRHHTQKPDATKLLRPLEDALTGVFWRDDAQITAQSIHKHWALGPPGASVTVTYQGEDPCLLT